MGLNSFKNSEPKTNDDESRLMCSVPGCTKRWSVHINGAAPKCSEHQWMTSKKPSEKTIDAWYKNEEF